MRHYKFSIISWVVNLRNWNTCKIVLTQSCSGHGGHKHGMGTFLAGGAAAVAAAYGARHGYGSHGYGHYGHHHHGKFKHYKFKNSRFGKGWKHKMWKWVMSLMYLCYIHLFFDILNVWVCCNCFSATNHKRINVMVAHWDYTRSSRIKFESMLRVLSGHWNCSLQVDYMNFKLMFKAFDWDEHTNRLM